MTTRSKFFALSALAATLTLLGATSVAQAQTTPPANTNPYFSLWLNMQGLSAGANNAFTGAGGIGSSGSSANDWSNMAGRIYGAAGPGGICSVANCIGNGAELDYSAGANANGWASHFIIDMNGGNATTYAGSASQLALMFQGDAGMTVTPMVLDGN